MTNFRSFASDNNAGIHPTILQAIANANADHVVGYGDDVYTQRAIAKFKEHLGEDIDVYFVFNGTGANVIALSAICQPYHAVICAETAHINVDECGAPEKFTGCKLIDVPTQDGKLTVDLIVPHIKDIGVEHHVQVRAVSITQTTELGTVYTPDEVRTIADFVHAQGLLLHMDGARISNAAAALGCGLREITRDCGVDVLSFGGTKNGLMLGEAVIFFPSSPLLLSPAGRGVASDARGEGVKFIRKQAMQLASKMRFIAAQFEALLSNDLWLHSARHANQMAQRLAAGAAHIPAIQLSRPVQANAVFAIVPQACIAPLQAHYFFYVWDEAANEVRWMTSFDTTDEDVENFLDVVQKATMQR
jgi:threonine aldolase